MWLRCGLTLFLLSSLGINNRDISVKAEDDDDGHRLQIKPFLHEPRIYKSAPPQTFVTQIQVFNQTWLNVRFRLVESDGHTEKADGDDNDRNQEDLVEQILTTSVDEHHHHRQSTIVAYSNISDYEYFSIDSKTGYVTTRKSVQKSVGDFYRLEVIIFGSLLASGDSDSRRVQLHDETFTRFKFSVQVTEFNHYPPIFEKRLYKHKIHSRTPPGVTVLQVKAEDMDSLDYNAEVFYSIVNYAPLRMDSKSGTLSLSHPLDNGRHQVFRFDAMAEDGGSPKRYSTTKVELTVTTISEPIVVTMNATFNQAKICWLKPLYGQPDGFVVDYVDHLHTTKPTIINMTTTNSSSFVECIRLFDLSPNEIYKVSVTGWKSNEIGLSTAEKLFNTHCDCDSNPVGKSGCNPSTQACLCLSNLTRNGNCVSKSVDPCQNHSCLHNGTCTLRTSSVEVNQTEAFCECNTGFGGKHCEIKQSCDEESTLTQFGVFRWPSAPLGTTATVKCPHLDAYATRDCLKSQTGSFAGVWSKPKLGHCSNYTLFRNVSKTLDTMLESIKHIQKNGTLLVREEDLLSNLTALQKLSARNPKMANKFVNTLNTLIDDQSSEFWSKAKTQTGTRLVKLVDDFLSALDFNHGHHGNNNHSNRFEISIESPNIGVKVVQLSALNESITYSKALPQSSKTRRNSGWKPWIRLPLLQMSSQLQGSILNSSLTNGIRIKFAIYANGNFLGHSTRSTKTTNATTTTTDTDTGQGSITVSSPVIQASLDMYQVNNLREGIMYGIPFNERSNEWKNSTSHITNQLKCVYLDEESGQWKTDGLTKEETQEEGNFKWKSVETEEVNQYVTCRSTHLTAFSVLLDPGSSSITTDHLEYSSSTSQVSSSSKALSVISLFGCFISILGLLLTLLTYSLFGCLRKDNAGRIIINLCFALLGLNVLFFFGTLEPSLRSKSVCTMIGIGLHYFLLSSFAWMTAEAFHIHQLLVNVFKSVESHYMKKRFALAWGTPLLLVALATLIQADLYGEGPQRKICMISSRGPVYYLTYLIPAILLISTNFIVFLLVTRVVFGQRVRPTVTTAYVRVTQIRGAFILMTLLGVTWIFGLLPLFSSHRLLFDYLFCIFNSSQGFLIFFFRVLRFPDAQKAWRQLFTTGTLRNQRNQSIQCASWTSSSNADRSKGLATRKRSGDLTKSSGLAWSSSLCRSGGSGGGDDDISGHTAGSTGSARGVTLLSKIERSLSLEGKGGEEAETNKRLISDESDKVSGCYYKDV